MALTALNVPSHSQQAAFSPPPLQIQKKPRRATFRKRVFRKSSHHIPLEQYVGGPLDDIIDEIRSDICGSPLGDSAMASSLESAAPLEVPLIWTVTPLPVSRLPNGQPLMVRKNRESRSSASGSSMGEPTTSMRRSGQEDAFDGGPVGLVAPTATTTWPLLDVQASYELAAASNALDNAGLNRQTTSESTARVVDDHTLPTKRRPSVLRLLTGLSRLRRTTTGETSSSNGDAPSFVSPTSLEAREDDVSEGSSQEPSEAAVDAYIRKNARNEARLGSIASRIARRLPSPMERRHEDQENQVSSVCVESPTTLRASVRIFSEAVQLSTLEQQEFWIAIEVEGAPHNRVPLLDGTIDIILVIDNAYYVSRECLTRALAAVNSALYHLDRGDRVALYTTHCTHQSVTGNRPDLLFPIGHFNADTEDVFRELTSSIARCGTQAWKPPRPNPSMAEVLVGIAQSLKNNNVKDRRTHVLLLSPAAHVLHEVSRFCPDLYIHHINPAPIPFRRVPGFSNMECTEKCCENVFVSNWNHFQSLPSRIKRVLKYARSKQPVGEITQVSIDLRTRDGCEIIEYLGCKDIASLRLGQAHTIFAKLRTTRSATKAVDLLSKNPVFNSSLDVKDLRQQLHNTVVVGAVQAHLLDVQVYHQNALHGKDCWMYTETPFLVVRDLGGLVPPFNTAVEVHKRRLFHIFVHVDAKSARLEAKSLLSSLDHNQESLKKIVQRMVQEIDHYQQVLEYEQEHRQKLPLCPGPIALEAAPYEWLVDMWNRRKTKRQGVAVVEEEFSGLIDGLHGLERLG
ncbi:hypothetical protein SVAN01_09869 [Stagonosporopsis vannaccii]|nr:hypothetical protein SVAN01_09869 [Stagonosporopsis vannaccii]